MSNIILKIQEPARQTGMLNKLLGNVTLSALTELLSSVQLEANPRLAKVGRVTTDIEESLENEPENFHFMTKGILIAASEVEELDRSRFKLTFDDPDLEGILDGGHNSLAAGRFILRKVLTEDQGGDPADKVVKTIKTWADLKAAWEKFEPIIKANKASIPEVLMPVEVIYPNEDLGGHQYFQEKVLIINAARNNNAELTPETKANKRGYYTEIRDSLDAALVNEVEWKANDGGRLKVRELVALSLIPLSKLGFKSLDTVRRSPSVIFSSKGQCVSIYNDLMEEKNVVAGIKGDIVDIVDPGVKSALALMKDLPALYDMLYELTPDAYNKAGGKFGKILSVKVSPNGKPTFKTHFYRKPIHYSYGDGYIYPLMYGLSALMKEEDGQIKWTTNPHKFLNNHISGIMKSFIAIINGVSFDPAKVGKSPGAYNLGYDLFAAALKDEVLKQHGLA